MKIVYEENEIEKLEQENSAWKEKGRGGLFDDNDPDRVYSLNFKVTNPVLAEYWIPALLFDELRDFDLGISIESINIKFLLLTMFFLNCVEYTNRIEIAVILVS